MGRGGGAEDHGSGAVAFATPERQPVRPPWRDCSRPASNGHAQGHYRLRYDRLDNAGKMSLRRAGRMHHLGVGAKHARKRVLALADDHRIIVTDLTTGEILSTHLIDPKKTYWRNQNQQPGRWPHCHNRDP